MMGEVKRVIIEFVLFVCVKFALLLLGFEGCHDGESNRVFFQSCV